MAKDRKFTRPLSDKFSTRLRSELERWGGSQADLARASGLSSAYISWLLSGRTKDIGVFKLQRVEKALGLRHGELTKGLVG